MATLNTSLGARICAIRKAQGMKQKEFAAALKVEPIAVSRWENDVHVPELHRLRAIAELGGVSLDYLVNNGKAA